MNLQIRTAELYRSAHELSYLGANDEPVYADHFSRLNAEVYHLSEALYLERGRNVEEEAALCVALLAGFSATFIDHGNKDEKIQTVLDRSWEVLTHLPAGLLRCQLLLYCYGEVYEKELIEEARQIIMSWGGRELTPEENEMLEFHNILLQISNS